MGKHSRKPRKSREVKLRRTRLPNIRFSDRMNSPGLMAEDGCPGRAQDSRPPGTLPH
jgi:hypothetical protein